MAKFLFYRCGMHHEEFQLLSSQQLFSEQLKRNKLCSKEIRSKNIFCSHGSALNQLIREKEMAPEFQDRLIRLQNQLFALDHQKGELEKYIFQIPGTNRDRMESELEKLIPEYHVVCDQIQELVSREETIESIQGAFTFE